jgi:type III restriction enzyme
MSDMKFKFTIQNYQTDAVKSIINVFAGQPFQDKVSYRRDTGTTIIERNILNYNLSDEELYMGFANAPVILKEIISC